MKAGRDPCLFFIPATRTGKIPVAGAISPGAVRPFRTALRTPLPEPPNHGIPAKKPGIAIRNGVIAVTAAQKSFHYGYAFQAAKHIDVLF